jgi:hypothetical protein
MIEVVAFACRGTLLDWTRAVDAVAYELARPTTAIRRTTRRHLPPRSTAAAATPQRWPPTSPTSTKRAR